MTQYLQQFAMPQLQHRGHQFRKPAMTERQTTAAKTIGKKRTPAEHPATR